jgi:hypothetical protein
MKDDGAKAVKAKRAGRRTPRQRLVAHLAGKLGFETIESRNLDRLDFRDVGVAALRDVLGEAIDMGFELGYRLGEREAKMA